MPIEFVTRGHRRKPGGGLYYRSTCGRYELYKSDQVAGVRLHPPRWLAIAVGETHQTIISRHWRRGPAEKACRRHARQTAGA